jgi:hypothetical protein
MNGTTSDLAAQNIQDKTLINQFNRVAELSTDPVNSISCQMLSPEGDLF